MFGALPATSKQDVALPAELRQPVSFRFAKRDLLRKSGHFPERQLVDVAQKVFRIDVVVARVHIAVVLNSQTLATRLAKYAQRCRIACEDTQGRVENLNKNLTNIVPYPVVVNGTEKAAKLLRLHTPGCNIRCLACPIPGGWTSQVRPGRIRRTTGVWSQPLHQRDKLEEASTDALEKPIDLKRVLGVKPVDDGEDIERDAMSLHQLNSAEHLVERRPLSAVSSVRIMEFHRTIEADANQKVVTLEEAAPFVVEKSAVGLDGICDALSLGILALQGHRFFEKPNPKERGLPSLPRETDLGDVLQFNVLLDVRLKHVIVHCPAVVTRVQLALLQVKTVGTGEITDRADGFGHNVDGKWRWTHDTDADPASYASLA